MKSQNHHTLPDGWEIKRLGELAEFKNGLNYSQENSKSGVGLKIIGVGDFKENFTIGYESLEELSGLDKIHESYLLKNDDLLFVRSNGSKDLVGRALFIQNMTTRVTHSGFTIRARLKAREILPVIAAYYFQTDAIKKQLLSEGGGTNISNLSQGMLASLPIPLPPLAEQKQIAAVLGTWDRAIEQSTELLKTLRIRHRGLMHHLLTGQVRLPGYVGEWHEHTYEKLLREIKRKVSFNDHSLYHLISVKRRSGGLFHRQSLYGHQILTKNLSTAREGDFLFSKMQIVHGASGLTTSPFDGMMISGSYIAVVARDEAILDMEFFNWLSKMPYFYHQTFVSSYGVHIEKMTFDFDAFLGLATKIPPTVDEQRAIADVLDASLREIRQHEAKLEALREQKRGLLQCLLTGQVRVSGRAEA